ncbi:MAG: hypothetical protein ACFFB5_07390 [Promethearchaeota archaeon]
MTKSHIIVLCMISTIISLPIVTNKVNLAITLNNSTMSKEPEEERVFWTYNYIKKEYWEVNSRLLAIGDWCYIYMEEECIPKLGENSIMAKVEEICYEFDNVIYPRIIDLAGHPNGTMGDIDGDPRIYILFLDNYNYYSEVNDIEHNVSNLCEMIYICYRLYHHDWLYATMAHEFHHLIWFNNDWGEPPFTLEALAQYATYHAGYLGPYNNLVPQVAFYLPHPENSPLYWTDDQDYGSAYLFAFYIAEKYGVDILRDLITEPDDGPHGIETVLHAAGYDITFNELFMNWITTLTLDELGFQNNLFGFEGFDARITNYEVVDKLPLANKTISVNHYAFYIHKLEAPPNNFTVIINKVPQDVIGISLAVHDSHGWYVNQNVHYLETSTITESFSGSLIDEAYLITSYISENTPIAPEERGSGPSTSIDITIIEGVQKNIDSLPSCQSTETKTGVSNNTTSKMSTTTSNHTSPFSDISHIFFFLSILLITFKKKGILSDDDSKFLLK